MTILSIVFTVIIFSVVILIHELGHFIVAKACGIKVNEFAIGMGPAVFKKQKGETLYAVRIFPIGGYCSMEGEDDDSEDERSFNKKPVSKRIMVVTAGVVMNLILGYILLVVHTAITAPITSTKIAWFEDNAKSHSSGLEVGDEIVKINGMRIFTITDMSYQFQNDEDSVFDMTVIRNGEKVNLNDVAFDAKDKTMHVDFKVEPEKANVLTVASQSLKQTVSDARLIYISLGDLITGKYSIRDLSGPVGIVDTIDQVIEGQTDKDTGIDWAGLTESMIYFAAFITINLGLFNLLPIPALDGGRLIFLIIEAIRRKPVSPEKEGMVHAIGMGALMLLMVVVTVSDIMKLF